MRNRGLRLGAATLVASLFVTTSAAQPYDWVSYTSALAPPFRFLTIQNLSTGDSDTLELPLPLNATLGGGAFDPLTGRYFLITSVGTGQFVTSPPHLLPEVLPWRGTDLFLAPDGLYAYICSRTASGLDCDVTRRSDNQVIERIHGVTAVAFTEAAGHVVVAIQGGADATLRHAPALAPAQPNWTRTLPSYVKVSIASGRIFALHGVIEVIAPESGTTLAVSAAVGGDSLAAGAERVFVCSSGTGELRAFDMESLAQVGEVDLTPGFPFPPDRLARVRQVTADGSRLLASVTTFAGSAVSVSDVVLDPRTLERLPGGGSYGGYMWSMHGQTVSSDPWCGITVMPPADTLPPAGGAATFSVSVTDTCGTWRARDTGQAALLGPSRRRGPGQVVWAVPENSSASHVDAYSLSVGPITHTVTVAPQTEAPNAPRVVGAAIDDSRVRLTWELRPGGPTPTSVTIEGGVVGGPVSVLPVSMASRRIDLPPLPPGAYEVRMRAQNAVGTGEPSTAFRFDVGATKPPDAPTRLAADVRRSVVALRWQPPAGGQAPSSYLIEASIGGRPYVPVIATPDSSPELEVGRIPAGGYRVRVRAVNRSGASPPSESVDVLTSTCTAPPAAPASLQAVVTGGLVSLRWAAPAEGADAYVIEAGSEPGLSNRARLVTSGPATTLDVPAPSGPYAVRVRGINACGLGAASSDSIVLVP
jgi:hypothetical protein